MNNQEAIKLLKSVKDILPYHNMQSQAIDHAIMLLAEPSDADVAEAVEVQQRINHTRDNIARMVLMEWAQPAKAIQQSTALAIQCMRQYQKPTDEAVQRSIEDLLSGVECADELTDEEYIEAHLSPQGHELAIQALRQYQDEGCQCDQCAGTRKMSETDKQILKGRNSL